MRAILKLGTLLVAGLLLLAGCLLFPAEAVVIPPPVLTLPEPAPFVTVEVSRGNVQVTADPLAVFIPAREERLSFEEAGVDVLGIFFAVGDEVNEGDVVAALYVPEIQRELEELNRRRSRFVMELNQVNERHRLALSHAEVSRVPVDDSFYLERQVTLRAEILLLDRRIEYFRVLDEARYLYAPISGVVTQVAHFADGVVSRTDQLIMTLTDTAFHTFVVRQAEAVYMLPDDVFEMSIGQQVFLMRVVEPEDYGFIRNPAFAREAFLVFLDAPPALGPGVQGRVHMVFEEVQNVLYIPLSVLRRADERTFVYVLEDGLRAVRDVVVGLEGAGLIEIVSGMDEGEWVIR